MSQRPQHIARAWGVLEVRELARALYARQLGSAPEQVFYSTSASRGRPNAAANRYSNVLPYDRAAVATEDGAYVNASVVRAGGEWWVAAQAPLPDNFAAFFRAILHRTASHHPLIAPLSPHKSAHAILVQLTGWNERGTPKADDYMPKDVRTFHHPVGNVHLTRTWSSTKPNLGAEYTEMALSDGESAMTLHHYFYGAWPDHGVPEGKAVAQLSALVREVREKAEREGCEVWVHCSAGVGRTGTFIMLSSMLDRPTAAEEDEAPFETPLGPLETEHEDPIARRVDAIREYRCMLVQAPQQLALLYAMMAP